MKNPLEPLKKVFEPMRRGFRMFSEMSLENLRAWRMTLVFLIVMDILGVYWFLKLKTISIAIFFIICFFLTIILFFERGKDEQMSEEKLKEIKETEDKLAKLKEENKSEEKDSEEDKDESMLGDFKFGMPTQEGIKEALEG